MQVTKLRKLLFLEKGEDSCFLLEGGEPAYLERGFVKVPLEI